MTTEYETKQFAGKAIRQRISDGYLNATDMCKANGKEFANYVRLQHTNEYLTELSCDLGICMSQIIEIRKGNSKKYQQGTWVHPLAAIHLAQWLSPKFSVAVSKWVFRFVSGDPTLIDEMKTELVRIQMEMKETQTELKYKQDELKQSKEMLMRVHEINEELVSYKKLKERNETIYVVTTRQYANQGLFKVGRTTNLKQRITAHNTSRAVGDKIIVVQEFKVNSAALIEGIIDPPIEELRVLPHSL